ncbi:MAG TPA: aminotransferase class III-fold pyridoxal phosphate-dependent enzyme [Solirubrobacteraceae bacterium]|nr:aminotransferase class III-fold pyridoxal phosphate-dependent enzyme [Solirubrobacteraceae bacterium]
MSARENSRSNELYGRATRRFPGGASRTTLAGGSPARYAACGEGWRIVDVDGRELIDLHGDYSALVHGNAFGPVVAGARAALECGSAFGMPTAAEVDLADALAERVGWAERWRFTGSGSDAVMAAVRAARAVSGRERVVRFAGCYHGGWDALAQPGERGVPRDVSDQILTLPLGEAGAFEDALVEHDGQIACALLDLMPNRAGLSAVERAFAEMVRERTREHGIALILDEVITFRLAPGGMQQRYGIEGDMVTLGKLVGGGLPVGALGGRPGWMDVFDPGHADAVALAGTFAANPVSMRAGLAALEALDGAAIERIDALGARLREGLIALGYEVAGEGSLCKLRSPESKRLWSRLYEQGVLIAADGLMSISTVMDERVVDRALSAFAVLATA